MYQMVDDGIPGGVAMISTRYARANNPEVERYDPTKPISWIKGLDANNLYGWSMAQQLPYSDFEWVDQDELTKIDWLAQTVNQEIGYIAKVDLEYSAVLHDKHNDYPLAPERIKVQDEWLSDTAVNIRAQYKIPRSDCNTKLIPNLMDKHSYVLHYRLLSFYLTHGLILKKVHAAIKFHQKAWLKPYIELNQKKRAEATCDLEKDFYKLMNNSVFGKTCENMKKRTNIKLIQDPRKAEKLIANPAFMDVRIFSEDLIAIELQKTQLKINKPFYAGFTILDLAKLHMYQYASVIINISLI